MSKKQTTPQQFKIMVDFMVANPDIGTGSSQQRPEEQNGLWEELSVKLNSAGPPIRDVPAWKKVWRDYKANTKKKMVTNKQQMEATGGGPNKNIPLNDLEEAVSELLNYKTSVHGIPKAKTFGIPEIDKSMEKSLNDFDSYIEVMPSSSKKRKIDTPNLLQQQIDMQRSFYDSYISLKKEEISCLKKIADGIHLLKRD